MRVRGFRLSAGLVEVSVRRAATSAGWGPSDLLIAVAVSSAYLVARWISSHVVYPIQTQVLTEIDLQATLVFLPHGVKIVAAWVFGWRALAYLLPALAFRIFTGGSIDIPRAEFALLATFLMASAPLSFSVMRAFGIDVIGDRFLSMNWRVLLFVGLVSSVMNAVAIHVIAFHELPAQEHLPGMLRVVAGDMVGLFVVLTMLMMASRWMRALRTG